MSGLVKGVKKVFKKAVKFVKKYWKVIAIAVAVYFTAGVALSYFGSTAAFASSMPGFGAGGWMAKAATAIGFQGSASVASGLSMTSGAWAGSAAAAYGTTAAASSAALTPVAVTGTKVTAGGTIAQANAASAAKAAAAASTAGGAATGVTAAESAIIKGMATSQKLATAQMLLSTASGLMSKGDDNMALLERKHELENAQSFGVGRDGDTATGWGNVGSDAFAGTNKRGTKSQFAQSEFLPTSFEQGNPNAQMNEAQETEQSDFISAGYQKKGYMGNAASSA